MLYKKEGINKDFIDAIKTNGFNAHSIDIFHSQYEHNSLYKAFTDTLNINAKNVHSITDIPFLPISFFKTHKVLTGSGLPELVFESSGTTGSINSKHYVLDKNVYRQSILHGFQKYYGTPSNYAIVALLPSYLERTNASLVHMVQLLMEESKHPLNGFYLDNFSKLADTLNILETRKQNTILLGVTFGLLDFAEMYQIHLKHTIVVETGGMKGRREEWTRAQVHQYLKQRWQLNSIHSEYGMTELLSQSYSKDNGIFHPTDTIKVLVRDINDPLDVKETGTGCLNIIDLANIYSCSFIATDDIGTVYADGSFEVIGRADHSALRGCSLMAV